jgi:hypothetical protein
MRMMLRIVMPVETGNAAVKDGSLPRTFQSIVDKLKPETAYFFPYEGRRSAQFVFDMQDASQLPSIAEPLFTGLNADVSLFPVMNFADLQKGLTEAAKLR